MKKALGILSILILIASMVISCSGEQKVDDTVQTTFSAIAERSLDVVNDEFIPVNHQDLDWYYHGEKKFDLGFTTGQSSLDENSPDYWTYIAKGNDLAGTKVKFSQGQWTFRIKAMKGDLEIYNGATNGNILLSKNRNNVISISVSPISSANGTLVIEKVSIDPNDRGSADVAPNKLIIDNSPVELSECTIADGSISYEVSVAPGTHTVRIMRVSESDPDVVIASASKTVIVYSGLTTVIKGSVEEDTTSGSFNPEPIRPEASQGVTVPPSGDAVVIFNNVTPSMVLDKATTVTIPSDAFQGKSNVVLDIAVVDADTASDSSFTVSDGSVAAASISLTMTSDQGSITSFTSPVTVTTYIEKDLTGVSVRYNGAGAQPTEVEYNPATGELSFKTTHFSEFIVEAKAFAMIGEKKYYDLQKAFDEAGSYDTVVLKSDVDPKKTLVVSSKFTLDLNGYEIKNTNYIWNDETADWSLISVRGGDLIINGNGGLIGYDNDCFALDVRDDGKLVINGGKYVGNSHAVYVFEGSLVVNGGEFSVIQKFSASQPYEFVLNCYDANYKNGTASILVTGGTFYGYNPSDCECEGKGTSFLEEMLTVSKTAVEGDYGYVYTVDEEFNKDHYIPNKMKVSSAESLLKFASIVNDKGYGFAGKTIELTKDIDLAGIEWKPVGQTGGYSAKTYFQGTFDGKGKTISNLSIPESTWEAGENEGKNYATGFFGFVDVGNTVIKNVTFSNATVEGHHWVGVAAGYMTGTIEGVKVENSVIASTYKTGEADGDKAGGVAGFLNSGLISRCTVEKSTVKAVRDSGSIAGMSNGSVTGNTAKDCTVYYSTDNEAQIGGEIAGKRANGVSGNTAENVIVSKLVSTEEQFKNALTNESADYITLANDITITEHYEIAKSLVINLNGFKLTLAENLKVRPLKITGDGITVKVDGTKEGSTVYVSPEDTVKAKQNYGMFEIFGNDVSLILDGGEYLGQTEDGAYIRINGTEEDPVTKASIYMKGIYVNTNTRFLYTEVTLDEVSLVIEDSEITVESDLTNERKSALYLDCWNLDKGSVLLNNVTINTNGACPLEADGLSVVYNNCEFRIGSSEAFYTWNPTAITAAYEGNVDVNKGTFYSESYGVYIYSSGGVVNINDDVTIESPNYAVYAGNMNDSAIEAIVNIKGGTIKGKVQNNCTSTNSKIVISGGYIDGELNSIKAENLMINGGTFTSDPTLFVVSGFAVERDEEAGTWTVRATE